MGRCIWWICGFLCGWLFGWVGKSVGTLMSSFGSVLCGPALAVLLFISVIWFRPLYRLHHGTLRGTNSIPLFCFVRYIVPTMAFVGVPQLSQSFL